MRKNIAKKVKTNERAWSCEEREENTCIIIVVRDTNPQKVDTMKKISNGVTNKKTEETGEMEYSEYGKGAQSDNLTIRPKQR